MSSARRPGLPARRDAGRTHEQGHRSHQHLGRRLHRGPEDGPEHGLGIGGERLHYWGMGGPWTYGGGHATGGMQGEEPGEHEALTQGLGCGIVGRNMYDAAGAWGGTNPFPGTLVVLTHR